MHDAPCSLWRCACHFHLMSALLTRFHLQRKVSPRKGQRRGRNEERNANLSKFLCWLDVFFLNICKLCKNFLLTKCSGRHGERTEGPVVGQHTKGAEVWAFFGFFRVCPSGGLAPAQEALAWVALPLLRRTRFAPALRHCCVRRLCSVRKWWENEQHIAGLWHVVA